MDIFKRKISNETALKAFKEFLIAFEAELETGACPVISTKFRCKMHLDNGLSTRDFGYRSWSTTFAVLRIVDGELILTPIDEDGGLDYRNQERTGWKTSDVVRISFDELQASVLDIVEKYNASQAQSESEFAAFSTLQITRS